MDSTITFGDFGISVKICLLFYMSSYVVMNKVLMLNIFRIRIVISAGSVSSTCLIRVRENIHGSEDILGLLLLGYFDNYSHQTAQSALNRRADIIS